MTALRRHFEWLLWALLAACIVRFWLPLLFESLWLDETITQFAVRHGASHPSFAPGAKLGETIYYRFPALSQALFGASEFTLRLPSLLLTLGSLLLTARIARRLIGPGAGWLAVFLLFTSHEFTRQATDARPYGLGTFVAVAAVWALIRWLDDGRIGSAILLVVAAGTLIYVHLLYWPFYAVFGSYAVFRSIRRETTVPRGVLGAVFAVVAAVIAWQIPVTLGLFHEAKVHVVASMPTAKAVFSGVEFVTVFGAAAAAWLLSRGLRVHVVSQALVPSTVALLAAWWLWQPVCLLVASLATGNSVFLGRYFALTIPGAALMATFLAGRLIPERVLAPMGAGLAAILLIASVRQPHPPTRNSPWREGASSLNKVVKSDDFPVLCVSPIVEAVPPAWTAPYSLPAYFYPHLDAYPIRGHKFLLPARPGPEGERYVAELLRTTLVPAGRFAIYGGESTANPWSRWLMARPELAGFHWWLPAEAGDVQVRVFER